MSAAARIEIAERQRLDVGKGSADIDEHLLPGMHHRLRVTEGRHHADQVDGSRKQDVLNKSRVVARRERIHHGANHIGADEVGDSRDGHHEGNRQKEQLVPAEVREKLAQRSKQVLGLVSGCGHQRSPPFAGTAPEATGAGTAWLHAATEVHETTPSPDAAYCCEV